MPNLHSTKPAINKHPDSTSITYLGMNKPKINNSVAMCATINSISTALFLKKVGSKQSQAVSEQILKEMPVDLVLVSPYQRALETCSHVFSKVKVPVVVDPLLAESCRYSCDILRKGTLEQKKRRFPHYNFHLVKQQTLAYAISEQKFKACVQKIQPLNEQERLPIIMNMLWTEQLFQQNKDLRERAWQIKLKLAQYSKIYRKICIVSHWYTLTYILSTKFASCGANLQYQDVENCKLYKYSLQDLLKIK